MELYRGAQGFIADCEKLSSSNLHGLKGTITSQSKVFLDEFHRRRVTSVGLLLENESWSQVRRGANGYRSLVFGTTSYLPDASSPRGPRLL